MSEKSVLFWTITRAKYRKFKNSQKILHLPLYKIEISGIIIIVRCASVAQSVEQGTENPRVIGSIPIGGTSQETQQGFQYAAVAHLVERHLAKVEVASSSLVARSKMNDPTQFEQVDETCEFGGAVLYSESLDMTAFLGIDAPRKI